MMIRNKFKKLILPVLFLITLLSVFACRSNGSTSSNKLNDSISNTINDTTVRSTSSAVGNKTTIDEDGSYTSKEDVALYIYTYKKLPKNFITKKEAKKLGWVPSKNNLGKVAKGKSIGGDIFSNFEKVLPVVDGRKYYECDIDYAGKKRNAKRIVYADDFNEDIGFIYYTEDHYKTFKRLY